VATKIGIVASSGGSVAFAAYKLLRPYDVEFYVVTDRACGIETLSEQLNVKWHRVEASSNQEFSIRTRNYFDSIGGVDFTVLFFLRLVTQELLSYVPCINIHPSLLPSFPGFNAIKRAKTENARFLGATAHLATPATDSGPIIAQVIEPLRPNASLDSLKRISYAQKLYLFLVLRELWDTGTLTFTSGNLDYRLLSTNYPITRSANPGLSDVALQHRFLCELQDQGIEWQP
jgi:folate-dependent phosphoribosylglycinamide formyltransferase PurN